MAAEEKLVLQDNDGNVLRTFAWSGEAASVIQRLDSRRLEIHPNLGELEKQGVAFVEIGKIAEKDLKTKAFQIGDLGQLSFVETVDKTLLNPTETTENNKVWWTSLVVAGLLGLLFSGFVALFPNQPAEVKEELREQVVQIIKRSPRPPVQVVSKSMFNKPTAKATNVKTGPNMKRMGALAALGSLSKSSQKSGVDIGAINTTAGAGRGGTAGSGGVQTSLYGKGLIGAPVGPGANINGAGGYGTKGKGGGKAGYGTLSLVGTSGSSSIPLGNEAVVQAGLDRDMIAAVIQRNMGQVRYCYEQGLQSEPGLNGRVSVDFVIGGSGLVKSATLGSSSLGSAMVEQCIVMRLKSWKFPLPEGGVDVKVAYPFLLKRVGG